MKTRGSSGDSTARSRRESKDESARVLGNESVRNSDRGPRRVRLPGFISDEEIGLGDLIKRVTTAAGIKPCGGCLRRAEALNRRLVFSGRRPK